MIRLPLTSISLSAVDIESSLQDIDLYLGLLAKGFKKTDVQTFFEKRRATNEKTRTGLGPETANDIRACSTVEFTSKKLASLSLQHATSSSSSQKECQHMGSNPSRKSTHKTERMIPNLKDFDASLVPHIANSVVLPPSQRQTDQFVTRTASSSSSIDSRPLLTHVPRQSSLLRFSEIASTPRIQHEACVKFSSEAAIIARDDTNADPHSQLRTDVACDHHNDLKRPLADLEFVLAAACHSTSSSLSIPSSLHSDDDDFAPLKSITSPSIQCATLGRFCNSTTDVNDNETDTKPTSQLKEKSIQISPLIGGEGLGHKIGKVEAGHHNSEQQDCQLSGPPLSSSVLTTASVSEVVSLKDPEPLEAIETPLAATGFLAHRHTDPRQNRNHYLDGTTFIVYSEVLPASQQPQTPADLSRHTALNERSTGYTAPPGRINGAHGSHFNNRYSQSDAIDPSPTMRAIDVRNRRNREYRRSLAVEGLRLSRSHRHERDNDGSGVDAGDIRLYNGHFDTWRDDLDADRVGEENYSGELGTFAVQEQDPVRALSSNQRNMTD